MKSRPVLMRGCVTRPAEHEYESSLFLSDADLIKLTGYAWKSKQIRWLTDQAIPFRRSATGHPVVTRAAIEGRLTPVDRALPPAGKWVARVVGA